MRTRLGVLWILLVALCATPPAAAAPGAADDPDALLLKSGAIVPQVSAAARVTRAASVPRHLLIQFEQGRTQLALDSLRRHGATVLEWVPKNAVAATVPAGVDPLALPGVRWAGALRAADKLFVAAGAIPEEKQVLVDFFPDVKPWVAARLVKRAGGRVVFNPHLPARTLLVSIEASRLKALAKFDEVSFVYAASKAVQQGLALHTCPGALSEGLHVANFATNGSGWDGPGLGAAALTYYFHNATPDLANAQTEVVRALNVWTRYAAISFSPAGGPGGARSLAILFASSSHGDGNAFDGPSGVLAHAYFPSPPNPEPIAGDMHFDEDEFWRAGANIDLFSVALHEAGHSLGLGHSSDPNAVMYPHYLGVVSDLRADDIAGIRALYATNSGAGADSFEPDDSFAAAQTLSPNTQQSHSIVPATDTDYARFTLSAPADVVIETTGAADDTRMWLYDANQAQIEFNDDVPGSTFARIDRSRAENNALAAGTYFVRVDEFGNNAQIANYNLGLQVIFHAVTDSFEPDDAPANASALAPGAPQLHSIDPAGDGDYARFSLTTTSEVVIETRGAAGDTRMWLFAQDLSALEFNDDVPGSAFARIDRTLGEGNALPPGTYYILVDESGGDAAIGAYELELSAAPVGAGDDAYEENDGVGEAWYGGFSWENTWLSSIRGPGVQSDDDWYRIDVTPGAERILIDCRFSHAEGDIDLFLTDATGAVIAASEGFIDDELIDVVVSPNQTPLYIRVAYGNAGNVYDLWWDDLAPAATAPANDLFAARLALAGTTVNTTGSNLGAGKEPGEPTHANAPGGKSVWWSWTAPQPADVSVTTSGSGFDTLLAVYTGSSVTSLTLVAENDDAAPDLSSGLSFNALQGQTYAIAVDGYNGESGQISLQVGATLTPPPVSAAWSSLRAKCKTSGCKLKGKLLVRNAMSAPSPATSVAFYFSADGAHDAGDQSIGGGSVASLKPGKSKKVKLKTRLPAVSGRFVIAVIRSGASTQVVPFGPLP